MSNQLPKSNRFTIAFYNTENLWGYKTDPCAIDHHLNNIAQKRLYERYLKKVFHIGTAISKIGASEIQKPPALIGLAEVETAEVLADLMSSAALKDHHYGFVHYDSPDERGMDVALIYDKECFKIIDAQPIVLQVFNDFGMRNLTRDILLVTGYLNDEKIYVLVNHWPSRHATTDKAGQQRLLAARKVVELIESIRKNDVNAKIIVMGDFNDNPKNESLQYLKKTGFLHNPMEELQSYKRGSFNHHSKWMLFDQILLSTNFLFDKNHGLYFLKADIFDADFLKQTYGKSKNHPFMTYDGKRYMGGYSDHFPVYVQLSDAKN